MRNVTPSRPKSGRRAVRARAARRADAIATLLSKQDETNSVGDAWMPGSGRVAGRQKLRDAPERIPAVCKAQERHRLCEQQPVKREHREAEPRRGVSNREPRAHGRTHFQYELVNAACSEV